MTVVDPQTGAVIGGTVGGPPGAVAGAIVGKVLSGLHLGGGSSSSSSSGGFWETLLSRLVPPHLGTRMIAVLIALVLITIVGIRLTVTQ